MTQPPSMPAPLTISLYMAGLVAPGIHHETTTYTMVARACSARASGLSKSLPRAAGLVAPGLHCETINPTQFLPVINGARRRPYTYKQKRSQGEPSFPPLQTSPPFLLPKLRRRNCSYFGRGGRTHSPY